MSEKIKGTKKGDVLLDATTLVFSNDLLVDKKVSVETVFDLGVLLESLVLNERILTVQPANDPKNKFENVKKFIGDDFIEAVNVSHDGGRQWEYFEWCRLLQEGKSFFPIKLNPYPIISQDFYEKVFRFLYGVSTYFDSDRTWDQDTTWFCGSLFTHAHLDDERSICITDPDGEIMESYWDDGTPLDDNSGIIIARSILYYYLSTEYFKVPYKPDSFRTPIIKHIVTKTNENFVDAFGDRALRSLENMETKKVEIREKYYPKTFTANIPLFLNVVLDRCKTSDDILPEILEIRKSSKAKDFRRWCGEVDKRIKDGENVDKEIRKIESIANDLMGEFKNRDANIIFDIASTASASFGPGSISGGVGIGSNAFKKISDYYDKHMGSRQLLFLHDIKDRAIKIKALNTEIDRIFGKKLTKSDLDFLTELQQIKI